METSVRSKNRSGISLTELVVVIAIIGICAAIAVPGMSGWLSKNRLNSEAKKIYSVFELARSEAIKTNNDVSVVAKFGSDFGKSEFGSYRGTNPGSWKYDHKDTVWVTPKTSVPKNIKLYLFNMKTNTRDTYSGVSSWGFTPRGIVYGYNTPDPDSDFALEIVSSSLKPSYDRKLITVTPGGGIDIK